MSSLPSNSRCANRAQWTPSHDSFAVGFLAEQKKLGRFSDNGFKKEVWKKCLDELNKRFDISVTPTQLKSHIADLQKRYRIVKAIREQSGFGWDDLLHMCTADDDVWNRYIKAHPEAKIWRRTPFPLYDELSGLYDGALAEGKREMSSNVPFTQLLTGEQIPNHNTSNPTMLFSPSDERLENINSSSDDDMGIEHLNRNRPRAIKTASAPRQKRFKATTGDRLCEEISKMVASADRLNSVNSLPPKDPYAYELCMEELQKMEGLEEGIFMQAIEVLRDRQYAIAFMTLREPMRMKWLQKKCGGA